MAKVELRNSSIINLHSSTCSFPFGIPSASGSLAQMYPWTFAHWGRLFMPHQEQKILTQNFVILFNPHSLCSIKYQKMTTKVKYVFFLLVAFNLPLFSQNETVFSNTQEYEGSRVDTNNLILRLNEELFTNDTTIILLYEYIGKTENPYFKVDSAAWIRKHQPEPNKVLLLLEQFMHTKDTTHISDLSDMYEKHIINFWDEWAQVYMDNYYSPDVVIMQYTILSGFETVLKSLNFLSEGYEIKDIFEHHKYRLSFLVSYLFNSNNRCELMKLQHDFSPLYRKLSPCSLFGGRLPFNYMDPYMDELKPYFLESMNNCIFGECSSMSEMSMPCLIFTQKEGYFKKIAGNEVAEYYINNFDEMRKCNRHTMAFRHAGANENLLLSKFLAQKLIFEFSQEELRKYPYVRDLISYENDFNLIILLDELTYLYQSKKEKALNFMNQLPRDRSVRLLESRKKIIDNLINEVSTD
ncbi:MAG: hypothetical protein GY754_38095 [bacterium]|nr:hypothetical protein [bacterium]